MTGSLLLRVIALATAVFHGTGAVAQSATVGGQVLAVGSQAPISGVQVVIVDAKGRSLDSTQTDRSGLFYVAPRNPGEYRLRFGQRDLWFEQSSPLTVERGAFHQATYLLVDHSNDQLLTATDVEQPALPIRGNRAPRYPVDLRQRGVQGPALVRFNITSDGHVARGSARVASASAAEFGEAVLAVVYDWRFEPAAVGGRPVPVLVCMPSTFQLTSPFGQATLNRQLDSLVTSWPTKGRCPP